METTPLFELNHQALATNQRFAEIATELSDLSPIDSEESFNLYCREACRVWIDHFRDPVGKTSPRFAELLEQIERRSQNVIKTAWGGVVITLHEHPRVEKFLVIRQGGYLALEMHEEKDEHLEVREGAGLILWRRSDERLLRVEVLKPLSEFHLEPGVEHCLIATENLLVFERSVDPKGMDQDLIFIYEPDGA
jgi:mannose-6-phosphate isomerase-like protein (cupin superfamily)